MHLRKAVMYLSLRLLTVVHANRWDDFVKDLILLLMPWMVKSSPKSGIFCKSVVIIIFLHFFKIRFVENDIKTKAGA